MKNPIEFVGRKIISWLVETFYPSRIFWGHDADPFAGIRASAQEKSTPATNICGIWMAGEAARWDSDGFTLDLEGVTDGDKNIGDWRITVERMK